MIFEFNGLVLRWQHPCRDRPEKYIAPFRRGDHAIVRQTLYQSGHEVRDIRGWQSEFARDLRYLVILLRKRQYLPLIRAQRLSYAVIRLPQNPLLLLVTYPRSCSQMPSCAFVPIAILCPHTGQSLINNLNQ